MKAHDYEQLVKTIDSYVFKYPHEYFSAFAKLLNEHKSSLSPIQKEKLNSELAAFLPHTQNALKEKGLARFGSGHSFTEKQLKYFSKRANTCANTRMRQRYLDILWEHSPNINKHEVGTELISTSLHLAADGQLDDEFAMIDYLDRTLQVSVMLFSGRPDKLKPSTEAIIAKLHQLQLEGKARFTLDLIETVILYPKLFSPDDHKFCYSLCEEGVSHFTDVDDNTVIRGAFIQNLHKLKRIIDPSGYDTRAAARDYSQTFIDEAAKRSDSIMVQQHYLVKAEKVLKDAGLNGEANEIRARVEKLGKSEQFNQEFQTIEVKQQIPQEAIDALERLLRNYDDTSALIAISPNFIPSWSKSMEEASAPGSGYVSLTDIITIPTHIDENGMTVSVDTSDSNRRAAMRHFEIDTELKTFWLSQLIPKLIQEGTLPIEKFEIQFHKIQHINKDCWESVRYGLQLFFKEEYYAASLILTTQLENLIFNLLPIMGVNQYIFENDGLTQSPKTLGWILPEIKEFIGEDLYELANYILIDKAHLNIRGRVAHGKTNINSKNLENCIRVLQLFCCLLVSLNINQKDKTVPN